MPNIDIFGCYNKNYKMNNCLEMINICEGNKCGI